jgi:hypothetical protein
MTLMSENPKLEEVVAVLERTPASLTAMLLGLPEKWTTATEGSATAGSGLRFCDSVAVPFDDGPLTSMTFKELRSSGQN